MATVEITAENIQSTVADNEIVLLDFWASWCGPCKRFGPIFEASSEQHPDVVFGKINTEEQQQLAASFGVQSIPMVVAFRQGVILFQQPGMLPGEALTEIVQQLKAVDMEDVHKKLAEQEAAQS